LQQCLLFDIEVNEQNRIYSIGAVYRGEKFQINSGREVSRRQLQSFDDFSADASFILGHNILAHDIPRLRNVAPSLAMLARPAIDTLYLSPLAYPENPYHRLVKDYKLVRDSVNEPCEDALLAGKVFSEQWDSFEKRPKGQNDIPALTEAFWKKRASLPVLPTHLEPWGFHCWKEMSFMPLFPGLLSSMAAAAGSSSFSISWPTGHLPIRF